MTIRLVLDTSALVSYANLDGLAVGELITMVEEDHDDVVVGIPAVSLLEAHGRLKAEERDRLRSLATRTDASVAVLPLLGGDALDLAELADHLPSAGLAHAVRAVRQHDALLATHEGDRARTVLSDDEVIDL